MIRPMSAIEREARIAGYAYRVRGWGDEEADDAAFNAWLDSVRPVLPVVPEQERGVDVAALREQWDRGMEEFGGADAAPSAGLLSPREVATLKRVTLQSVYAILQDDDRRAQVFPSAQSQGKGKRRTWLIPAHEADEWQPVRGRGRKAKGDE